MEEQSPGKSKKPSKFLLDKNAKVSPREFTNLELRKKALDIKNAKKYKKFLETEFKLTHEQYKDKITQFEQLTEYLANYIKFTTQEDEPLDPEGIWEFKIHVQDRGTEAYFCGGTHFKEKSEKQLAKAANERDEVKKATLHRNALKAAQKSEEHFKSAYDIENCNKDAQKLHKNMLEFCEKIKKAIRDSKPYRLGIDQAKIARNLEQTSSDQIVSARGDFANLQEQLRERRHLLLTPRKRSNTLGSLRRILPKKKNTPREEKKEKRKSLPSPSVSQELVIQEQRKQKELCLAELDNAETLCLQVGLVYMAAFDAYPNKILLTRAKKILQNAHGIEEDKLCLSPHMATIHSELAQLDEKIKTGRSLLKKQEENSSSNETNSD